MSQTLPAELKLLKSPRTTSKGENQPFRDPEGDEDDDFCSLIAEKKGE